MAILENCNADTPGAYALIQRDGAGWKNAVCPNAYVRETHHGLVLGTGERNGYDDSDFTATVWNEDKQDVEVIVYATTRYPTYHLYARVDASAEVMERYRASSTYKVRRMMVMARRQASKERFAFARMVGCTPQAVVRFNTCPLHPTHRDRIIKLLTSFKAGKLRSKFKMSLAQAVIDWMLDPEPKFKTPLSTVQLGYL